MSRGSEAAPVVVIVVELLQTRMHHPYRCCVAMRLRVETRDRCLSCARRSRSWIDPRPGSCYIYGMALTKRARSHAPAWASFIGTSARLSPGRQRLAVCHAKLDDVGTVAFRTVDHDAVWPPGGATLISGAPLTNSLRLPASRPVHPTT